MQTATETRAAYLDGVVSAVCRQLKEGKVTKDKLEVGQRVVYRGAWGEEEGVETVITSAGTHKGQAVYDNALGHWGYAYQYEAVEKTASEGA